MNGKTVNIFKKLLDGRPISAESIKAKNDQLLE